MVEPKKKLLGVALAASGTVLVASLAALVLLLAVQGVALNIALWQKQWERLGVQHETGMSQEDLVRAGRALISYFEGDTQSPQMTVVIGGRERILYSSREIQHLADVRELYRKGIILRNGIYVLVPVMLGVSFALWRITGPSLPRPERSEGSLAKTRETPVTAPNLLGSFAHFYLARIALVAGIIVLALALFLAIPAVADFSDWWTGFHRISFSNELWLLDPATEWLIKMFPLDFFFAVVVIVWRRAISGGLLLTLMGSIGTGALGKRVISLSSKLLHRRPRS